jgi:hypothetical protein
MTPPIGMVPEVTPLAKVIMSGRTPNRSAANGRPSLPKAVMTSSKMSRIPCLSHSSRSRFR